MIPIPKRLLIHTAALRRKTGGDCWGAGEYEDTVLENVRLEYSSPIRASVKNTGAENRAVLYIDRINSTWPERIDAGDIIIFDGKSFTVTCVRTLYGFSAEKPHHLEVGLV